MNGFGELGFTSQQSFQMYITDSMYRHMYDPSSSLATLRSRGKFESIFKILEEVHDENSFTKLFPTLDRNKSVHLYRRWRYRIPKRLHYLSPKRRLVGAIEVNTSLQWQFYKEITRYELRC